MRYKNLYEVDAIQYDFPAKRNREKLMRPVKPYAVKQIDLSDDFDGLSYCWMGHSSVYLNIDHIHMMIDPVFSKHLSFHPAIGPKRFDYLDMNDINVKKLDAILITHNHYDHLDRTTIMKLDPITDRYIVPAGVKRLLVRFGIHHSKIQELQWYESCRISNVTVTCTPAHHNSGRALFDGNTSLWCSYVIENDHYRVFHSGDTALSPHFIDIAKKWDKFDLVFMECGQYGTLWHGMHMFPEESVNACRILNGNQSVPIHHSMYCLSSHDYREPMIRFTEYAKFRKVNFRIPELYKMVKYSD